MQQSPALAGLCVSAVGHADLQQFCFEPGDTVWVFAYSRIPQENQALLERLTAAGVSEIVYLSSSSTIVAERTACYEYPRVKLLAQQYALSIAAARVLTLGLVYGDEQELPAGPCFATSIDELAEFFARPMWPEANDRITVLARTVTRPFPTRLERILYAVYGQLIRAAGPWPCILRPIDLGLRLLRMRWYGYTYLSNHLWTTKTS